MATGCLIGVVEKNGLVKSIICYQYGYIEHPGVGYTLAIHYRNPDKVEELINLGNLDYIEITPDRCKKDSDSRGSVVLTDLREFIERAKHHGYVYNYFFFENHWYCYFQGLKENFIADLTTGETNKGDKIDVINGIYKERHI